MAGTFWGTTAAVAAESISSAWESELDALMSEGQAAGQFVGGSSPDYLVPWTVKELSKQLSIGGLEFLFSSDPCQEPSRCCGFLLRTPEIDLASRALSAILDCAESKPHQFAGVADDEDVSYVTEAFRQAEASSNPASGEGLAHVLAYLKSLQWLFSAASANGLVIVHAQWC